MNTTNLKCWLPFDSSTTLDYCGNSWTTSGSPVIQDNQLYLNGSSYLKLDGKFAFTGQDFTISTKFSCTANTTGGAVCIWQLYYSYSPDIRIHLSVDTQGHLTFWAANNNTAFSIATTDTFFDGILHHAECTHSSNVWYLFVDGQLVGSANYACPSFDFDFYIGTNHTTQRNFKGYISNFIVYDGVALHTNNFTPPTVADYIDLAIQLNGYADLVFDADTSLTINNPDILFAHWVQPVLTDDNGTVGDSLSVSSGGDADSTAYKAFDGNAGTNVNKMNQGAYLQFVTAETIRINAITISSDGYLPAKGDFQISKDNGTTWQKVGEWNDTAGTSLSASVVFSSVPIGNYFRLVSGARATAHSGNADINEVVIDADVAFNANIDLFFDTSRNLKSKWRYENYGTADLLSVSGTTLTDLPVSQAVFQSAFYQTQRVKCFDIPATDDIWIKFDLYHKSGTSRFRVYDDPNGSTANGLVLTQNSSTQIALWSYNGSSNEERKTFNNVLVPNTKQTWLLHMRSGISDGLLELWCGNFVGTYTGNVNNGTDFSNFYLQTDSSDNLFSNVIISNYQIGLTDSTSIDIDIFFDTSRKAATIFSFDSTFDTCLKDVINFDTTFDTLLKEVVPIDEGYDTIRKVERTLNLDCDTLRKILHKLIVTPCTNGVFTDAVNSTGVVSIEIDISTNQLLDRLTFTTINPIDVMQQVTGQILDYAFNYRVENTSSKGIGSNLILTTCSCCSDIDELLYTQHFYKLAKETWNGGLWAKKEEDDEDDDDKPNPHAGTTITEEKVEKVKEQTVAASSHINKIASQLHKTPILLFDDFQSTVEYEQEGTTYQDLISEIFGWSSRVPHKLINVFIRDKYLYVIERGHEQHTWDLSNAEISKDVTVQRQLVRTSFGFTTETTNLTKEGRRQNGAGGHWEMVLGNEIQDEEPETPEEEPTEPTRNLPRRVVTEENGITTTIEYQYDFDGNIIRTDTRTRGGDTETWSVVENEYTTRNSEKLLKRELTYQYEWNSSGLGGFGDWDLVDKKVVNHEYTTVGQQHVSSVSQDGTVGGSITTPARHNDKPTPYDDKVNQGQSPYYMVEKDGYVYIGNGWGVYTYVNGTKTEVVGLEWVPNELESDTVTGTRENILLYDSSFPVDDTKDKAITAQLKWLNRKIQESVSITVNNFNHVFDFNDKIVFNSNTYYLESNSVTKDAHIVNQQDLQLVRWY